VACHANGPGQPNHAVPFLGAAHTATVQAGFDDDCAHCHAVSGASPLSGAPLCTACHQAASPLAQNACTSCHAKPPAGTAFPDTAGAHARHEALAGVTGQCATCHSGSESGTASHYTHANARPGMDSQRVAPAPVQLLATFNAKAGAAALAPATLTCSNVSCHGGLPTPAWGTGTLASGTDAGCRACHQVGTAQATPENNSAWSGLHAFHLGASVGAACTDCHGMANGKPGSNNHFAHLDTPQMEGPASDTITLPSAGTYDAVNQTCTVNCHNTQHAAFSWKGGASHPVPFTGTAHTAIASQTAFNSGCASCHGASGASPLALAPTCATCHQAASPLTMGNCASCHSKPPVGTAFPDVAGAHGKHGALPELTGACGACHAASDSGTQTHYDHANARAGKDSLRVAPAPTTFAAIYNAKAGAAAFAPATLTCSNVSCHGGLATPAWGTGTLDSTGASGDTGCRACHAKGTAAGTPEANSYYSGAHSKHLGTDVSAKCTDCHAMANGTTGASRHFTALGTAALEGPASDTIQYQGSRTVYNATAKTCTLTCHGENHSARHW
jgi:predicted CxxxxCH...CXXCH cytochrome family protein